MSSESVDRSDDLRIAMIVSSFLACTLHTIGFWALWNVKHKNIFIAIERLYLLNLSVAENIHSSFLALSNFLFLYKYDEAGRYMFICGFGGAFVWYMSVLIMFTFDRFLSLYLNVRYTFWLNKTKTLVILVICFGFGVFADALLIYFAKKDFEQTLKVISVYLWVPFDGIFILVAISTYIYILVCIKRQRREDITKVLATKYNRETENASLNVGRRKSSNLLPESEKYLTWKSFIVPLLLISSFLLLIGIPDNIFFWSFILKKKLHPLFEPVTFILYPTGISADAIIYTLCPKNMRQFLMRKFKKLFCRNHNSDVKLDSNEYTRI